jgi:hypothetical protein
MREIITLDLASTNGERVIFNLDADRISGMRKIDLQDLVHFLVLKTHTICRRKYELKDKTVESLITKWKKVIEKDGQKKR